MLTEPSCAGMDVVSQRYWLVTLGGLTSAGGANIDLHGHVRASIDTGFTLIGGPDEQVDAFYSAIPGAGPLSGQPGYHMIPCDARVSATMHFGNQRYTIPDDVLAVSPVGGGYCMGALFGLGQSSVDSEAQWIIGTSFLSSVYSVFSANGNTTQVGFAALAKGLPNGPTIATTVKPVPDARSSASTLFANRLARSPPAALLYPSMIVHFIVALLL